MMEYWNATTCSENALTIMTITQECNLNKPVMGQMSLKHAPTGGDVAGGQNDQELPRLVDTLHNVLREGGAHLCDSFHCLMP